MTRESFVEDINSKLKLIRIEYGLTQDKMAGILGISKKTLVESEKGRRSIGWTECVAIVTIFSQSHVLQNAYGGDLFDIIGAIAFDNVEIKYPKTMGGKIWWRNVEERNGLRIQQNVISNHYRLLNNQNQRIISSFDEEVVREQMYALIEEEE